MRIDSLQPWTDNGIDIYLRDSRTSNLHEIFFVLHSVLAPNEGPMSSALLSINNTLSYIKTMTRCAAHVIIV